VKRHCVMELCQSSPTSARVAEIAQNPTLATAVLVGVALNVNIPFVLVLTQMADRIRR
jgi:hypothetical protein